MYTRDDYIDRDELLKHLLYKKIVEWNKDHLKLEDGTIVTIEESEYDCCASAGGEFSNVELDAAITNVEFGETTSEEEYDTTTNSMTITLFHNRNPIAQADVFANDGNGGFYYSVASIAVNGIHHKVLEA